ncbi:MAG: tetratricopeptide repeat protein [Chitinophagales bacterium]|nr:tetratricopeptide repeat protein [Chitinophagaceae bacterium]MCB9063900.1 tetratricopeptide repeat protein [Chitinophagales bacterium]
MQATIKQILYCIIFSLLVHQQAFADNDTVVVNELIVRGNKHMLSLPDSGVIVGKKLIDYAKKTGIHKGVLRGLNITGMSYWAIGDFNNAMSHIKQMLKLAGEYKDTSELATAYGNIAILYIDMGDKDLGLEYSKKAIALYRKIGEESSAVHYINNIGWIYESKEMFDSSLAYYTLAKEGYIKYYESGEWLGQNLCNISSIYYHLNRPDSAIHYATNAISECRKFDNQKALGHSYLSMSKALLLNKKHHSSIRYADSALQIAQTRNIHTLTAEAYLYKYKNYEALGDYKQAVANLKLNQHWADSLLNEETTNELASVKTQLATEKKDKEIAQKETELALSKSTSQRNLFYLILAVLSTIFVSVLSYQLYRRQKLRIAAKNKELEIEQKEKQLIELELKNQELTNEELNKELLTYTLTTAQKNQLLQDINFRLDELNGNASTEVRKIKHVLNTAMSSEEEWEEFKLRFEKVHRSFFDTLKNQFPQLSPNDLRLCSFIKLNLNSKQVASLLNIAPSSVDISKYRLKKKLGLEKDDNLSDFISNIR